MSVKLLRNRHIWVLSDFLTFASYVSYYVNRKKVILMYSRSTLCMSLCVSHIPQSSFPECLFWHLLWKGAAPPKILLGFSHWCAVASQCMVICCGFQSIPFNQSKGCPCWVPNCGCCCCSTCKQQLLFPPICLKKEQLYVYGHIFPRRKCDSQKWIFRFMGPNIFKLKRVNTPFLTFAKPQKSMEWVLGSRWSRCEHKCNRKGICTDFWRLQRIEDFCKIEKCNFEK